MDIARLPMTYAYGSGHPSTYGARTRRESVLERVTEVAPAERARDSVEKVVQGEVLQRERTHYSATQDYLHSRLFDGDYSRDGGAARHADIGQANRALGAYQSHTRELIQPNANRGRAVDYFI